MKEHRMNDFLSALLERSTGDAPVLRPRRLSRFEPTRLANAETPQGLEGPEDRPTSVRRDDGPRPDAPATVHLVERVIERDSMPRKEGPAIPAPTTVEQVKQNAPAFPFRNDQAARRREERPVVRQHDPAPSSRPRPQLVVRQETTHRTTVRQVVERQIVERPNQPAAADGRPRRSVEGLRPATPGVVRPTPSAKSERLAQPAPVPTIHVSIGRIEIRAQQASPAPPARPPRANGPKLDLDQYLAGRNGSGR